MKMLTVTGRRLPPPPGLDVTWFGSNPLGPDECYGTADGKVLFRDDESSHHLAHVSVAGEAINGGAGFGRFAAFSTRADIALLTKQDDAQIATCTVPAGAHGVVAAAGGYFVAPLGGHGYASVKMVQGGEQRVAFHSSSSYPVNYFRMAAVSSGTDAAVVAAARRHGVVVMPFADGPAGHARTVGLKGADFVDVCSVGISGMAAVAIARDGSVLFFSDVLSRESPARTKVPFQGVIYRVACDGNHLFVLTSKNLYLWRGLAAKKLAGQATTGVHPFIVPLEAVDLTVGGDGSLCALLADGAVAIVSPDLIRDLAAKNTEWSEELSVAPVENNWIPPSEFRYESTITNGYRQLVGA